MSFDLRGIADAPKIDARFKLLQSYRRMIANYVEPASRESAHVHGRGQAHACAAMGLTGHAAEGSAWECEARPKFYSC